MHLLNCNFNVCEHSTSLTKQAGHLCVDKAYDKCKWTLGHVSGEHGLHLHPTSISQYFKRLEVKQALKKCKGAFTCYLK